MYETLKRFEKKYAPLKKLGLRITGLGFADARKKVHVIEVTRPFMFDSRLIPKSFEGMDVRSKISGILPDEFIINREREDWKEYEYVWAPERFEKYVDRCSKEIKEELKNLEMHKTKTLKLIEEGKLPAYSQS